MEKYIHGKLVEDAILLKHVPLLQKSLVGEWGYVYEELIDLSYTGGDEANRFMSYFYSKALGLTEHKARIIKIIRKISLNGSRSFRSIWRESAYDEILREYSNAGGECQKLSREIREHIFSDEVLLKDMDESTPEVPPRLSHNLSGLGSSSLKDKKYDGFGKDVLPSKERWTDKLRDLVEESLLFSNDKSKIIDECLSSESPGDYVPVHIPQTSIHYSPSSSEVKALPSHRTHVPGKAGGGWESEDEDKEGEEEEEKVAEQQLEQISKIALNMTHSELVVEMREDMLIEEGDDASLESLESKEINSFCDKEDPPRSYKEAIEVASKLKDLNILTSLAILKSKLGSSKEVTVLRALLLIEILLRSQIVRPKIYKEAFEDALLQLQKKEAFQFKARKINYSIENLLKNI